MLKQAVGWKQSGSGSVQTPSRSSSGTHVSSKTTSFVALARNPIPARLHAQVVARSGGDDGYLVRASRAGEPPEAPAPETKYLLRAER